MVHYKFVHYVPIPLRVKVCEGVHCNSNMNIIEL